MVFFGVVFSEEAINCLPQLQHQFGKLLCWKKDPGPLNV
jgi:hypothetical protein